VLYTGKISDVKGMLSFVKHIQTISNTLVGVLYTNCIKLEHNCKVASVLPSECFTTEIHNRFR